MFRRSVLYATTLALAPIGAAPAQAQDYAAKAINTPDPSALGVYGAPTSIVDDAKVPGGKALRVQANKGANPWDAGVGSPIKQPVKAGDALVLAFWARLESAEGGATTVSVPAQVALSSPPWTGLFGGPVTIGPEWKLIEVRGTADKDYPTGTLSVGFQVAGAKQTIDFGPVYVAKASGGLAAQAQPTPAPAPSTLASLDPNTIASKIVNDPAAPEVRGIKGKLIDDPKVTGGKALHIEIPRKGQNAWDISVNSAVKKPVKAGDTLLLVFDARLLQGENGATTTTLPWNSVSLTGPPWSGVIGSSADIGPEWKTIEIKGKADKNYAVGQLAAGIQLATAKQTVELGPLIVLDLGPTP